MAPVFHRLKGKIRVPLMRCVDLVMSYDLRIGDAFVFGRSHEMLRSNKGIAQEFQGAHHPDEFLGRHVLKERVSHDTVVDLLICIRHWSSRFAVIHPLSMLGRGLF